MKELYWLIGPLVLLSVGARTEETFKNTQTVNELDLDEGSSTDNREEPYDSSGAGEEIKATVDRGVVTVTQSHRSQPNYPQSNSGDRDISPDDDDKRKAEDRDGVVPDETDESDDEDEEKGDLGFEKESPNAVAPPADIGKLENDDHEHKEMLTPDHPGILALIIGGSVLVLLLIVLVIMFIVYRLRKKDEGSYALDETMKKKSHHIIYTKAPNGNEEFFA